MEAIPTLNSSDKFTSLGKDGQEITHNYGKVYEVNQRLQQLKIGASTNQVGLLLKLAETMSPPFFILYVLVISRLGNEHGRYQSPLLGTRDELVDFLQDYKEYFETDGRHHVWICSPDNSGKLIYDQHNVIYAYGPLDNYISILTQNGFREEQFDFPAPHAHAFNSSNDKFEERIFKEWDWSLFPLKESDTY